MLLLGYDAWSDRETRSYDYIVGSVADFFFIRYNTVRSRIDYPKNIRTIATNFCEMTNKACFQDRTYVFALVRAYVPYQETLLIEV